MADSNIVVTTNKALMMMTTMMESDKNVLWNSSFDFDRLRTLKWRSRNFNDFFFLVPVSCFVTEIFVTGENSLDF